MKRDHDYVVFPAISVIQSRGFAAVALQKKSLVSPQSVTYRNCAGCHFRLPPRVECMQYHVISSAGNASACAFLALVKVLSCSPLSFLDSDPNMKSKASCCNESCMKTPMYMFNLFYWVSPYGPCRKPHRLKGR